jgi:hypothetical protein
MIEGRVSHLMDYPLVWHDCEYHPMVRTNEQAVPIIKAMVSAVGGRSRLARLTGLSESHLQQMEIGRRRIDGNVAYQERLSMVLCDFERGLFDKYMINQNRRAVKW